jgi:Ser/Thr protein kinase RdoA (MazF antagonist)
LAVPSSAIDGLLAAIWRSLQSLQYESSTLEWKNNVATQNLLPKIARALHHSSPGSSVDRGAAEQLLHGEPHPWNVLSTKNGPLFIDFENSARGPVEYDLAWVPEEVSAHYPAADQQLVGECRGLMLAIVAACHWRRDD